MRQVLTLLFVFLAGIAIGAWALAPEPEVQPGGFVSGPAPAGDYARLEQMIDSLTEIVNFEVSERRRLEAKLDEIVEQLADLDIETSDPPQAPEVRVAEARELSRTNTAARRRGARGQVTEQRLIEAGFPADVAGRLKRQLDEIEMERLYLRDEAVRDGWLGSQRYRDQLRELSQRQSSIRDELSPEDYDRYLYALGRPNRIGVDSVLSGSPADQSGLRTGDQILSYDGTRVFTPGEIRRQTSQGTRGEMVAVEILRNGEPQVIYVPRGPLGIQMDASVTKP